MFSLAQNQGNQAGLPGIFSCLLGTRGEQFLMQSDHHTLSFISFTTSLSGTLEIWHFGG